MAIEIKVPSMGESITSGILSVWNVANGDFVKEGDVIYELETDKVTSEVQSDVSGMIRLSVEEGEEVVIGQTVASIEESASAPSSTTPTEASGTEINPISAQIEVSSNATTSSDPVNNLSPAARRVAIEKGIDPGEVVGTGKGGRVTKGDLMQAAHPQTSNEIVSSEEPASASSPSTLSLTTRKKMTPLRRKIAERLVNAQQEAAMLTTFNECDLNTVISLRKRLQEDFVKKHGVKLGFMSFFVKAVVHALQSVPRINAQIDGDEIVENHFYDIGVAVSTTKGLVVPVLRGCDQKSFAQIESEIIEYASKARDGKIKIEDLTGGVFTITNGGIFGSMLSTPILNAPQSAILGMHAIQQRPVAINNEVKVRPMMYTALSYDHRIVDGKEAVTFLVKIKQMIESPELMLFDL